MHGVGISSQASRADVRNLSLYSVSKIAMERWSDYMNFEAAERRVGPLSQRKVGSPILISMAPPVIPTRVWSQRRAR
jgi:hypothetical protein